MTGPRYTAEQLLHLRQSPLVYRPKDLPAPEEWMGWALCSDSLESQRLLTLRSVGP